MFNNFQRRLKIFWIVLSNYEYWPWWVFYIPTFPVHLYCALKLRSLAYITVANPGIEYGGFFGEKKNEILQHIPAKYKPASYFFEENNLELVLKCLNDNQMSYPIIFKPDVGERGEEVTILRDEQSLKQHLELITYPFLIQRYVEEGIELGVFYSRLPESQEGKILSIVQKKFLTVIGDGNSTVAELLNKSEKGLLQLSRFEQTKPEMLLHIPDKGEHYVVERIGNHCLGTDFLNANHLINSQLDKVFDEISLPFEGFYYGRYDLKVESIEQMYRGEGIQIFELNGVTSEPGHIYDNNMTLFQAYADMFKNHNILLKICQQNIARKYQPATFNELAKRAFQHVFLAKR